ncbi:uncharacterized protein LOC62_01G001047 [Vanrija pseudolonga]|uniref:Uncharacterized protein n=1 Tax=Vanrija pseudolonga TaxID=143232 RepID=A0AAF0Y650_9TREE|nr:hypothetical protein LOC62_01G001047 [Vanrija pseudolonga]
MKTGAPATATAAAISTPLFVRMVHATPIAEASASVTPVFGITPAKHGAMSRTGVIVLVVVVGFVLAVPAGLYFCYIRNWARLRQRELVGDKPLPPTESPPTEAAPFLPASIMSYDSAAPSYRSEEIPRYTFVDPFAPYIQMAFPSGNLSLEDVVSRV